MKISKKKLILTVALTLSLSTAFTFLTEKSVKAQTSAENSQKQVIIVLKDKTSTKNKSSELKAKGKITKEFDNVHSLKTNLSDMEIADLKNDTTVISVEEDTKVSIVQDTLDWGITKVDAQNSWNSGYTGLGVKIAVIDTGVDLDHPDFAGTSETDSAIAGGISEVDYTTSYEDDNGHGTHVAGIIGARQNGTGVIGIAPNASIYAVKALDSSGSGYVSSIIGGINWAIENNVDIINMSLGSKNSSTALQNACDIAYYNNDILLVAAAGNSGTKSVNVKSPTDTIEYPARYNSVISVGAIDSSNKRASFSSTGKELEVVAPGVKILSDYLNGDTAAFSGTSMASPYAAGDLALLKEANPLYTNAQLRSLLDSSATDLGVTGKDNLYGYGLIKAPVK